MLDLSKIKEDFSSMVLDAQPWTLAQFVMWLDLKLSEYKIKGYMVLDYQKKTKPRWLSELGDDSDPDSDTAPQPPPCRNRCCQNEGGSDHTHGSGNRQYSQSNSSERFTEVDNNYQDTLTDINRCIVDLSKEPMALESQKGRQSKEKTVNPIQIDDDGVPESRIPAKSVSDDVIEIESTDVNKSHWQEKPTDITQNSSVSSGAQRQAANAQQQSHQRVSFSPSRKTLPPNVFPSGIGAKVASGQNVAKIPSVDRRQQISSATITHPSQSSASAVYPPSQAFSTPQFFPQSSTSQSTSGQHISMETSTSTPYQPQSEAPLSRPVPVALHANFDPGNQRLFQSGEIIGEQEQSDGTTEIKQEFDISNLHLMTGFDDDMNPNTSISDNSHLSLSDDEFGRSKDSLNAGGGNPPLHTVRPISEHAKHIELPKFDDPLVRRVLEDTAPPTRHMWSKIITRCAYHMLSKGVPHKHDYQMFSEAFYYRYPCIGTMRGPNPWSAFGKSVSNCVRNLRYRGKAVKTFTRKKSFYSVEHDSLTHENFDFEAMGGNSPNGDNSVENRSVFPTFEKQNERTEEL